MKITPVKGCSDYLPGEAALRDELILKILSVYKKNGFERIYTPILEDAQNLENSEGGENLALIFKVLKRGDKLQKALEQGEPLSDIGLRYDLTLPLARFYANNRDKLSLPFKCIQTDRVYRAEQPQKGRMREFTQCDIDIIGSLSNDCEKEIIIITAKALSAIGFEDITIRVNDRALLDAALIHAGVNAADLPAVCVILDKLDKIGKQSTLNGISEKGANITEIENMLSAGLDYFSAISGCEQSAANLADIIKSVGMLTPPGVKTEFDFTLVRGQGYYTGPVFEIKSDLYQSSVAGGGRYDGMIGKFIGGSVPAVGFSIGFERIFDIISKNEIKNAAKKAAVFYNSGEFEQAYKTAQVLQADYAVTLCVMPKKLGKALNKLESAGYSGYMVQGKDTELKLF